MKLARRGGFAQPAAWHAKRLRIQRMMPRRLAFTHAGGSGGGVPNPPTLRVRRSYCVTTSKTFRMMAFRMPEAEPVYFSGEKRRRCQKSCPVRRAQNRSAFTEVLADRLEGHFPLAYTDCSPRADEAMLTPISSKTTNVWQFRGDPVILNLLAN